MVCTIAGGGRRAAAALALTILVASCAAGEGVDDGSSDPSGALPPGVTPPAEVEPAPPAPPGDSGEPDSVAPAAPGAPPTAPPAPTAPGDPGTPATPQPPPPVLPALATSVHDVGGMAGASTFRPVALLLHADPDAMIVVAERGRNVVFRRCAKDGSPCPEIHLPGISEGAGAAAYDAASGKVLVLTRRSSLYACDVAGTSCAKTIAPGTRAWKLGNAIVDPARQSLMTSTCGDIVRCDVNGTACVPAATLVPPQPYKKCPAELALTLDESGQKLIATAVAETTYLKSSISVFRCDVDGSKCSQTLLGGGPPSLRDTLPALTLDGKLIIVAYSDWEGTGLTLYRCAPDATECQQSKIPTARPFHPKSLVAAKGELVMVGDTREGSAYYPAPGWEYLLRCAIDGSNCTRQAAFAGAARDAKPSVLVADDDALYIAGARHDYVLDRDVIVRRPLDGSPDEERDLTALPAPMAFAGDALFDSVNAKLVVRSSGWLNFAAGPLARCELNGTGCSAFHVPRAAALLGFAGPHLVIYAAEQHPRGGLWHTSLLRCGRDGTACAKMGFPGWAGALALDGANQRVVYIDIRGQIQTCPVNGTTCSAPKQLSQPYSFAPGDGRPGTWGKVRNIAFDADGKLVIARADATTARCSVDGACTAHATVGTIKNPWSARPVIEGDAIYIVKTTDPKLDGPLELTRCKPDLSACTHALLLPAGARHRIHDFSVTIDHLRGKLLVVTDDELHARRPVLVTCNLDGSACEETDISGGQPEGSAHRVSFMHPTEHRLLVVTGGWRPTLLSVALP